MPTWTELSFLMAASTLTLICGMVGGHQIRVLDAQQCEIVDQFLLEGEVPPVLQQLFSSNSQREVFFAERLLSSF